MNSSTTINTLFKYKVIDLVNFSESIVDYTRDDNFNILSAIAEIKNGFIQWVKSGVLLEQIKEEFSYFILRNNLAKSWPDFCLKYFHQTHWYTDKLIDAAKVVILLIKKGFTILPNCEAQARELVKFLPQKDYKDYENEYLEKELCDKWQAVIDASKKENKAITAGFILKIVDPEKAELGECNIRVSKDMKNSLKDIALENGNLTIKEFLEQLIINHKISKEPDQEETTQEKLEEWQTDLENLLEEHDQETENEFKGFGKKQDTKQIPKSKSKKPNLISIVDAVTSNLMKTVENCLGLNLDLDAIALNTT